MLQLYDFSQNMSLSQCYDCRQLQRSSRIFVLVKQIDYNKAFKMDSKQDGRNLDNLITPRKPPHSQSQHINSRGSIGPGQNDQCGALILASEKKTKIMITSLEKRRSEYKSKVKKCTFWISKPQHKKQPVRVPAIKQNTEQDVAKMCEAELRELETVDEQRKQKQHLIFQAHQRIQQVKQCRARIKQQIEEGVKLYETNLKLAKECEQKQKEFEMHAASEKLTIIEAETLARTKFFMLASKQEKLKECIPHIKDVIQNEQSLTVRAVEDLKKLNESHAVVKSGLADLQDQLRQRQGSIKKSMQVLSIELSQIFVLRLQLNSSLFAAINLRKQNLDRLAVFNKEYLRCDFASHIRIDYSDLKRFIIIQLYRGWKQLLRKLSYQSSQYQVLFGEHHDEVVLEDLKRLLCEERIRNSYKKVQRVISINYEMALEVDSKSIIRQLLIGFDNWLIKILDVEFIQVDSRCELQIRYIYLKTEQLIERFAFQEHNNIHKQRIAKEVKTAQRRAFYMLEIPVIARKDDMNRYGEVFEMLRRKRPNK